MNIFLNENYKAFCYFLIGIFLTICVSIPFLNKVNFEKEVTIAYLSTLQSCTFSLTKKSKLSPSEIRDFCLDHSNKYREDFSDISENMNTLLSNKNNNIISKQFDKLTE